ncbi:MAG TPA: hypothetical protein VGM88_13060 [Kofleriaceae bacterium]|jgi:hypothetical protein
MLSLGVTGQKANPAVSDDGKYLYFRVGVGSGAIYKAFRASAADTFASASALTDVDSSSNMRGAFPAHTSSELFSFPFSGNMTEYTTQNEMGPWLNPHDVGFYVFGASLSADNKRLYIIEACPATVHGGAGACLFTTSRGGVGLNTYTTPVVVTDSLTAQWSSMYVSKDELRMLVSEPVAGSGGAPIAIRSRTSATADWGAPVSVDELAGDGSTRDARWSGDETEIYFVRGDGEIYFSRRNP